MEIAICISYKAGMETSIYKTYKAVMEGCMCMPYMAGLEISTRTSY
jgi:hypothetical protein